MSPSKYDPDKILNSCFFADEKAFMRGIGGRHKHVSAILSQSVPGARGKEGRGGVENLPLMKLYQLPLKPLNNINLPLMKKKYTNTSWTSIAT